MSRGSQPACLCIPAACVDAVARFRPRLVGFSEAFKVEPCVVCTTSRLDCRTSYVPNDEHIPEKTLDPRPQWRWTSSNQGTGNWSGLVRVGPEIQCADGIAPV